MFGAGLPAAGDTVDRAPALALHDHVEGTGCCSLRPMCRAHSSSFGRLVAARRRRPASGPVSRDSCEVCGRPLLTSERVELVEVVPAYVDPEAGVGGGGISATVAPSTPPERRGLGTIRARARRPAEGGSPANTGRVHAYLRQRKSAGRSR
jgi:hypothetical protein